MRILRVSGFHHAPSLLSRYLEVLERERLYSSAGNFLFYGRYIFDRVALEGRSVLDVGGGDGQYSFYALCAGAREVICIEPEAAGSPGAGSSRFDRVKRALGDPAGIRMEKVPLQAFDPGGRAFDVILLNNSINHLDEDACVSVHRDEGSRERYRDVFRRIHGMTNPGADLIVTDCARSNIFPAIGLKNPFYPMIEWHKHQAPEVWARLLADAGFREPRIRWTSFNHLRSFGRLVLGSPVAAWFLTSHFCLQMKRGSLRE